MLELLNQLDGFDERGDVKVREGKGGKGGREGKDGWMEGREGTERKRGEGRGRKQWGRQIFELFDSKPCDFDNVIVLSMKTSTTL